MEKNIYQIAEKISELFQETYDIYLPLVEDVCSRKYQKMNCPIFSIIYWIVYLMKNMGAV